MIPETFIALTAVLILDYSDGSRSVHTYPLDKCYAIVAAVGDEEGADISLVDELYLPENSYVTAAMCMDPFPSEPEEPE